MEKADLEQRRWQDRESLKHIIGQWNANRLDLFSLSEPNEVSCRHQPVPIFADISCRFYRIVFTLQDFEFHGVMRYYFQDAGQKIATKCIRVSSTASTQAVIETLIEKFRPDMKMLHMAEYALYEIHPNGGKVLSLSLPFSEFLTYVFCLCPSAEERCLGMDEKPLLVQLNWHKDDREGRFLLRRADEKSTVS